MRRGSRSRTARPLIRAALNSIEPYEGGKPVEEVERELGMSRVVKLASNEGPFGPFPIARQVLATQSYELNRYPDGGAYQMRAVLAERLGVDIDEVAHGAGADGLIGYLSLALLCHLHARHAQAGRNSQAGAAPRQSLRPRGDAGADRAEDEDRLHLQPQQSDRDHDQPRGARRLLRAR